ncbi:MAG: glycosyltransferase WbuB, partial [Alphaproteobacteria bacterium]
ICPVGKGYEAREEILEGIQVYRHTLPKEASGGLGYLIEYSAALYWETVLAFKAAGARGFDIIHGCNPPDLIFLVAWLFKPFGKKFIFDHHDINPELYEAKFGKRGLFWRLLTWVERLTFLTADVSIATNNSYRKIAIDRGKMRPEDVYVVRSGPDLTRVKAVPANPEWKRGRKYLVGYVGVMGDQEGVDLLLEAIGHIVQVEGRHDIQFCLVGGGPSFEALQALSRQMGLEDYVTFTGRAPDDVLFEVLSTSDVCVNPDRVNEMNDKSTMNKILEYMATSKPIVQFDVTEGRYSAAEASLYAAANDPISFAEKILELIDDEAKRLIMGQFGRARVVDGLSWKHEAPKLIEAYQRVWSPKARTKTEGRSEARPMAV